MGRKFEKYDLIIIGGGISATFLSLAMYKTQPDFKILIIEKNSVFPQKIGESVVDMTALYIKWLGIEHLLKKQQHKSGIRFLFNESNSHDLSMVAELASPTFRGLIQAYHLNRKVFDEDLLTEVKMKGATVLRPAEIVESSFKSFDNRLTVAVEQQQYHVQSRWLVDASGRTRYMHNKLGWKDQAISLNTGSIMAHFKNIAHTDKWDTMHEADWDKKAQWPRKFATTHLMRKNSWWWIIRLDEETTSIGVVFDKDSIEFRDHTVYFKELLQNDAQLKIITKEAEMTAIRHIEHVPYLSEKLFSEGVALIGDSGAFIDPFISPGLELIGQQTMWLSELLSQDKKSLKFNKLAWLKYERRFMESYQTRLKVYKSSYSIMHSFDLFSTWLKQANYTYFVWVVYPAVLRERWLKSPMQLSGFGHFAHRYMSWRFLKINERRITQNRNSEIQPNTLMYSGVRTKKNLSFVYIPIVLLFKAIWSYVRLEVKELKFMIKTK